MLWGQHHIAFGICFAHGGFVCDVYSVLWGQHDIDFLTMAPQCTCSPRAATVARTFESGGLNGPYAARFTSGTDVVLVVTQLLSSV